MVLICIHVTYSYDRGWTSIIKKVVTYRKMISPPNGGLGMKSTYNTYTVSGVLFTPTI